MLNGYADVGTFLVANGVDPLNEVFTVEKFLHLWLALTAEEVYDFSFATSGKDRQKMAMREQGTNYIMTLLDAMDIVCHKCNTTVTTTPMKMMDNKIKYGTWCSSCVREIQRDAKAKIQDAMSRMTGDNNLYSGDDRNVEREYKMVQVVDENGRATGKVVMKKRTPEEMEEYDFNIRTKGSYRKNIEQTGDPTGLNRTRYQQGVESANEGLTRTGKTYRDV